MGGRGITTVWIGIGVDLFGNVNYLHSVLPYSAPKVWATAAMGLALEAGIHLPRERSISFIASCAKVT
jgi:hypothetical protein